MFWQTTDSCDSSQPEAATPPSPSPPPSPASSSPASPPAVAEKVDNPFELSDASSSWWEDAVEKAERWSAEVLAGVPQTPTAKLAAVVAALSYLMYAHSRLETCAARP